MIFEEIYSRAKVKIFRKWPTVEGVDFWDFGKDPRFTNEDFYDGNHLNTHGNLKFTKIIDEHLSILISNQSTK